MLDCPCCGRSTPWGLIWTYPGANIAIIDGTVVRIRPRHSDLLFALIEVAKEYHDGKRPTPYISDRDLLGKVWGLEGTATLKYMYDSVTAIRLACRRTVGRAVIEKKHKAGYFIPCPPRLSPAA